MREKINDIVEDHCETCKIKPEIEKKFSYYEGVKYCLNLCPVGIGLKNIGDLMFNGETRKAKDLDQDAYERLSVKWSDQEICREYGISSTTLTRRKQKWGVIGNRFEWKEKLNIENYLSLKEMKHTDKEIAKIIGIGLTTLKRWKSKNEIKIPTTLEKILAAKTKKEYLMTLSRLGTDPEVAKSWGISERTLRRWKNKNGISHYV